MVRGDRIKKLTEKCKELGISLGCFYARVERGWTEEEALSIGKVGAFYRLPDGTPIYKYLREQGKNYYDFSNKMSLGYTREEALEYALNPKQGGNAKYKRGDVSLRQHCLKNGLNYYKEWDKERKSARKR